MTQTVTRPSAFVVWAAVTLLFIYFLFFGGAANYQASPQARVLSHVLLVATLGVGLLAAALGRVSMRTPLLVPGALWTGALVVGALTSANPEASREAVALLLVGLPGYFVVRSVVWNPELRPRVEWMVILATFVFVVAYLLQVLTQWVSWWSAVGPSIPPLRPGDVGLTVGTVNSIALYIELLVPVAVWLSWVRWRSRSFCALFAMLALLAFFITGSRGAWVGAAGGVAIFFVLLALEMDRSRTGTLVRSIPVWLRIAVALVALLAAVVVGPVLLTRLAGGDAGRFELWGAAWSIFTDHPLFGAGPGAWQGLRALEPISSGNLVVLYNAHDSVLQVLVETGLLGLVAAVVLVGSVTRLALQSIRAAPDAASRRLPQLALASLAAALVHSAFDTQYHLPAVVLMVAFLVAQFDPVAAPPVDQGGRRRDLAVVAVTGIGMVIGVVLLVPIDYAMLRAEQGNRALDADEPQVASAHFAAAVDAHDLPAYRLGQAIASSRLGHDRATRLALERAADREPYTFIQAQLAVAAHRDGDDAAARRIAEDVLRAGTYDPTATLAVAALLWDLGDHAAATSALTDVMSAVPSLIYSGRPDGFLDEAIWEQARLAALDRIAASDRVSAAAVAIQAGIDERAALYLNEIPDGPEREMLGLLSRAVGTGATDVQRARALVRANPTNANILNLHWAIGFAVGSQDELDFVPRITIPLLFNLPDPPFEVVLDGRTDAAYSLRLARWPMAASSRLGPRRPYIAGIPTIEPVYRPGGSAAP